MFKRANRKFNDVIISTWFAWWMRGWSLGRVRQTGHSTIYVGVRRSLFLGERVRDGLFSDFCMSLEHAFSERGRRFGCFFGHVQPPPFLSAFRGP